MRAAAEPHDSAQTVTFVLRTERLVLRPPLPEDVDQIVASLGDFEVAKWLMRVPHPYSRVDAEAWMEGLPLEPRPGDIALAVEHDAAFIGVISMRPILVYWLARPFWGRGLVSEAATALLGWHFRNGGQDEVRSGVIDGNAASLRIQEKLGFSVEGATTMFCLPQKAEVSRIDTVLTRASFFAGQERRITRL